MIETGWIGCGLPVAIPANEGGVEGGQGKSGKKGRKIRAKTGRQESQKTNAP